MGIRFVCDQDNWLGLLAKQSRDFLIIMGDACFNINQEQYEVALF